MSTRTFTFTVQSAQSTSALGDFIATMPVGQWVEFTQTPINAVAALCHGANTRTVLPYVNNAARYDPVTNSVFIIGRDHGVVTPFTVNGTVYDDASARMYCYTWDLASNAIDVDSLSPSPGHAYNMVANDPTTGDLYLRSYANNAYTRLYSRTAGQWSEVADPSTYLWSNIAEGISFWSGASSVLGDAGGVIIWSSRSPARFGLWRVDTESWVPLTSLPIGDQTGWDASRSNYHTFCVYSSEKNVAIAGGGNNDLAAPNLRFFFRLNADGTTTRMPDLDGTGVSSPPALGINQGQIEVDPVSGNFIVNDASRKMWLFDPTGTGTWTQIGTVPADVHVTNTTAGGPSAAICPLRDVDGVSGRSAVMVISLTGSYAKFHLYKSA